VPLDPGVSGLVTREYDRFWEGVRNLDPDTRREYLRAYGRGGLRPGETPTISLPGWNDVIQTGPRAVTTPADRREYYGALRDGRTPDLPQGTIDALNSRESYLEGQRTSGTPDYMKGSGEVLTALDNIQDLASTLATIGRLALWGLPRLLGRFVPIVGWAVLASDLLNLLSFIGTLATPVYALLCGGPKEALAAGVPGFLFKRALKAQTWKGMLANPFSRAGRLKIRARSLGRLPGFSNLVEVAQVTQALWGYGLALGALVGAFFEASFAAERALRGEKTRINNHAIPALPKTLGAAAIGRQDRYDLMDLQNVAGVLAGLPKLLQHPEAFDDDQVVLFMVTLAGAVPTLTDALTGVEWREAFGARAPGPWAPVLAADPADAAAAGLVAAGVTLHAGHALPGRPLTVDGDALAVELGGRCGAAMAAWLRARRNTVAGCLVGTLINQTCEGLWFLITGDPRAIAWELSTDARLVASLCEEGYLVNVAEGEVPVWRFWQSARAEIERTGGTRLPGPTWLRLAGAQGLTLIRLLPGDSPWPPEWDQFLAEGERLAFTAETDA